MAQLSLRHAAGLLGQAGLSTGDFTPEFSSTKQKNVIVITMTYMKIICHYMKTRSLAYWDDLKSVVSRPIRSSRF